MEELKPVVGTEVLGDSFLASASLVYQNTRFHTLVCCSESVLNPGEPRTQVMTLTRFMDQAELWKIGP